MGLRFGSSTTVLREHRVGYALERIAAAGFYSAEVWLWHLERWDEPLFELVRQARKLRLALTVHAPAGDLNPIALDPLAGRRARRQIANALQVATVLDAQIVTIHPGRREDEADPPELAWERMLDWLGEIDSLARQFDVQVGMELMEKLPLEIFTLPRDARRMMDIGYEHIGLTVDLAHLNTHGDPVKLLAQLEPDWIVHAHLSDNAPWRVHLPLGDGQMDIGAALSALESVYQGIVSLEGSILEQGESVLNQNKHYLNKLGWR